LSWDTVLKINMAALQMANILNGLSGIESLLTNGFQAVHTKIASEVGTLHTKLDTVNTNIAGQLQTVNTKINSALPSNIMSTGIPSSLETRIDSAIEGVTALVAKAGDEANTMLNPVSTAPTPMATLSSPEVNVSLGTMSSPPTVTTIGGTTPTGAQTPIAAGQQSPAEKAMDIRITLLTAQVSGLQAQMETLTKEWEGTKQEAALTEERLRQVELAMLRIPDIQKVQTQLTKKVNTMSTAHEGLAKVFTTLTPLSTPSASPPAETELPLSTSTTS
jgi:hypothetical protein